MDFIYGLLDVLGDIIFALFNLQFKDYPVGISSFKERHLPDISLLSFNLLMVIFLLFTAILILAFLYFIYHIFFLVFN